MEVVLYLVAAVAFTAAFLFLMLRAARAQRPVIAAFLGVMGMSTPLTYPLSMISAGMVSLPVGILIIAAMSACVVWFAYRAYRSGAPTAEQR